MTQDVSSVTKGPPSGAEPLIRIEGVGKTFVGAADRTVALRDISFDVEAGSFVSFVGPSGCGKTTLLKMCAGLISLSTGSISYRGARRPIPPGDMGMVFQTAALMPWRTVMRNITYPADVLHLDKREARSRALELLKLVGLEGKESRLPQQLSGGQQQRVSIARGLLHDPAVLLMDEPFGALDALTREDMGFELQRIHQQSGKTILFVTHSIPESVLLSDQIIVLGTRPGRILKTYRVPLPRPRTIEHLQSPGMQEISAEIRALLSDNESRSVGMLGD
ncbi:MAG: transporter ATP-binding protein [Subtercola sp.]|nr:transporter ATP-binding protein [Subtercola sp.]